MKIRKNQGIRALGHLLGREANVGIGLLVGRRSISRVCFPDGNRIARNYYRTLGGDAMVVATESLSSLANSLRLVLLDLGKARLLSRLLLKPLHVFTSLPHSMSGA